MAMASGDGTAGRTPPVHRFNKIATPTLSGVHPRERIHELLDDGRRSSALWISAPAGAGKTTAVANYLQARQLPTLWYQIDGSDADIASFFYYMSLAAQAAVPEATPLPLLVSDRITERPAFAATFFRELFARLPAPGVVVFDNFQDLEGADHQAALCEVLLLALMQAPLGTTLIFLSREEPPAPFARLRATRQLALLGWEALKLTEAESIAIVESRGSSLPSVQATARRLHEKTQGWVAGLLLLSERYSDASGPLEDARHDDRVNEAAWASETQLVFDYLGYEIFRRASAAEQEFLLTTALLPAVDIDTVQVLAPFEERDSIVERFARRNFFTLRHANGSYEYHPLFRAFLLSRGEQYFGETRLHELRLQVANLLAQRGDIEAGIDLLLRMREWESALDLILACARKLIDQGRVRTLSRWLHSLPEELRSNRPWALYWLGLSEMHVSGRRAREMLEQALAQFELAEDSTPVLQAWSAIVDSMVVEWNDFAGLKRWLHRYRTLTHNRRPATPAVTAAGVSSYMSGLLWAGPDDPDLRAYVEQTETIFRQDAQPESRFMMAVKRLLPYHWWAGDLNKFKTIYAEISVVRSQVSVDPITQLLWCLARAQIESITGNVEAALEAVTEGLAIAEDAGVHMFDVQLCREAICAHVTRGDFGAARGMLERMGSSLHVEIRKSYFHQFNSMVLLHEGQVTLAVREAQRALELSKYYIGKVATTICLAAALIAARDFENARARMDEARLMSERMGSELNVSICNFLDAQIHWLRGEGDRALARLGEFLRFARKCGIVVPSHATHADAAGLLSFALAEDFRVSEIEELIRRTRLPPADADAGMHWPWPVKIFTLGRFHVMKDGAPLAFNGKQQKKPLELLGLLVAFGGSEVGMNRISQLLWPDTDGDMARTNLRTTLMRLRRLIGEAAVLHQGNCLSLNPACCWIDVWAFERAYAERANDCDHLRRANRLFAVYRGEFLPDNDESWVMQRREQLRTRSSRMILEIGAGLEQSQGFDAAIDVYLRGIDVDPMAEESYRRLMECYFRTNRSAEALTLYRRYKTLLSRSLHIEPSAETTSLFNRIRQTSS